MPTDTPMRLVPVEPTDLMIAWVHDDHRGAAEGIYRTMVSAAPPVGEEVVWNLARVIEDWLDQGLREAFPNAGEAQSEAFGQVFDVERAARAILSAIEGET